MNVQPRTTRNQGASSDGPLVAVHRSKVGNMTLLFSPTVALVVRSRKGSEESAWIPLHLIPRFTGNVAAVYRSLTDGRTFHTDEGTKELFLDKKRATKVAIKMSLFKNGLLIGPTIVNSYGKNVAGIAFSVDGKTIGAMSHVDAMSLVDVLDRMDLATYSTVAGMVDKLAEVDSKTESILRMVHEIHGAVVGKDRKTQERTEDTMKFVQYRPGGDDDV